MVGTRELYISGDLPTDYQAFSKILYPTTCISCKLPISAYCVEQLSYHVNDSFPEHQSTLPVLRISLRINYRRSKFYCSLNE